MPISGSTNTKLC